MAADTFEILAAGRNIRRVAGQMRRKLRANQIPAIFQRPKKGDTWIL
jgi:predicted nucleic acid-binding protein